VWPQRHPPSPAASAEQRHTSWDFGELPELMEIRKGGQTLIGFPALIDLATRWHRGVRRTRGGAWRATAKACAACLRCRSGMR
jgi:hypothetical protein